MHFYIASVFPPRKGRFFISSSADEQDKHKTIYTMDYDNARPTGKQEQTGGKVTAAELYEYTEDNRIACVMQAAASCLGVAPSSFGFVIGCTTGTEYDSFGSPVKVTETDTDALTRTVTEYTYTESRKQAGSKTTAQVFSSQENMTANTPAASDVTVTHNTYNGTGDLIRTETYTEGEELTAGRQITEHVYDEHGNETMTRQYNTLAPSSVSCTELTCDKTGRTLTETGMNGESKTELSYTPDGAV